MSVGDMLFLAGRRYSIIETGLALAVSSEDAQYLKSRLYDGQPIQPFKFSTLTGQSIDIDGNRLVNGNLDSWSAGAPTSWNVVGTVVETTTAGEVRSGSAARINGSGLNGIVSTITARAGERLVLNGWRRILGAGQGVVTAYLLNITTGRYWNGSTWTATVTPFLTDSTNTSYTQYGPTVVTLEAYSVVQQDTCTLRLQILNTDSTATDYIFVDDWFLWPSIDFVAVFGHNIPAMVAVEVYRGATSPASTLETTLTQTRPAFYGLLSTVRDDRYWRILFSGVGVFEPIYLGEVVIGKAQAVTRKMSDAGYELRYSRDTLTSVGELGQRYAVRRTDAPRAALAMEFDFTTHAEMLENRDEIWARGDEAPIIVVPDSARPDIVMGYVEDSWRMRRLFETYYSETALFINGLPFPVVTA